MFPLETLSSGDPSGWSSLPLNVLHTSIIYLYVFIKYLYVPLVKAELKFSYASPEEVCG